MVNGMLGMAGLHAKGELSFRSTKVAQRVRLNNASAHNPGGIMNIVWIAGLAILVLLEKAMSDGRNVSRLVGLALIIAGISLIWDNFSRSA